MACARRGAGPGPMARTSLGMSARMPPLAARPARARAPRPPPRGARAQARAAAGAGELVSFFPRDYAELVAQWRVAYRAAVDDGLTLLEAEIPVGDLRNVPGDLEGNVEHNLCALHTAAFCRVFDAGDVCDKARVRVFFPDAEEVATHSVGRVENSFSVTVGVEATFNDFEGKLDYLCDGGPLEASGLGRRFGLLKSAAERVADADDGAFVVAYPSANLDEMLQVKEIYEDVARPRGAPLLVVNGELDRIRSNYYPPFWARKEMEQLRAFVPDVEAVYYIHNFKGSRPAVLYRCYPGPWRVLRRVEGGGLVQVHEQAERPSLKEVALDILPRFG